MTPPSNVTGTIICIPGIGNYNLISSIFKDGLNNKSHYRFTRFTIIIDEV